MKFRDEDYLGHILDAIGMIETYAAEGEEIFMRDRKTQDAIIRNLEIVGEAASKLSPGLQNEHADIPWARVSGMRNRLIHGYLSVDLDLVWSTVAETLPAFRRRIEQMLGGQH